MYDTTCLCLVLLLRVDTEPYMQSAIAITDFQQPRFGFYGYWWRSFSKERGNPAVLA